MSGLFYLSLPVSAWAWHESPVVCGHEMAIQDGNIYGNLHYGLHWFHDEITNQGSISYCDADPQLYFDPSKKHTMIFVHGFSPYSVKNNTRFNFDANDLAGPNVTDLVAPWLNGTSGDHQPWNVGIFYWNQFADEQPTSLDMLHPVQTAEAKIWRTDGPGNMRWRDNQGGVHNYPRNVRQDMAHILANQYLDELTEYARHNPTADMRLVGESLGSQLVIHAARIIADQVDAAGSHLPKNLIPKQVVVLDPIVTKDGNDETRLQTLLQDIQYLKQDGVIFSGYRTSDIGLHDEFSDNTRLLKQMAFSEDKPAECVYPGTANLKNQHTFAIWWYLLSYTLDRVPVSNAEQIYSAPFANMPDNDLKHFMDDQVKFVSNNAGFTPGQGECKTDAESIGREWLHWTMKVVEKDAPR